MTVFSADQVAQLVVSWILSSGPSTIQNQSNIARFRNILLSWTTTAELPTTKMCPAAFSSEYNYNYCPNYFAFCLCCRQVIPDNRSVDWLLPYCQSCYSDAARNKTLYTDYLRIPWAIYSLPCEIQSKIQEILLDKLWPVE